MQDMSNVLPQRMPPLTKGAIRCNVPGSAQLLLVLRQLQQRSQESFQIPYGGHKQTRKMQAQLKKMANQHIEMDKAIRELKRNTENSIAKEQEKVNPPCQY